MIAIPLCILAFAAGVALLIKVKQASLGGLYKALAWLVVLLSLLYMTCLVVRGSIYHRDMRHSGYEREMYLQHGGGMGMQCCPYMKGDSSMMKDSTLKGGMACGTMMGSCCSNMMRGCCGGMAGGGCCSNMTQSCCAGMAMNEQQCVKGGKDGPAGSCCKSAKADTVAKKK